MISLTPPSGLSLNVRIRLAVQRTCLRGLTGRVIAGLTTTTVRSCQAALTVSTTTRVYDSTRAPGLHNPPRCDGLVATMNAFVGDSRAPEAFCGHPGAQAEPGSCDDVGDLLVRSLGQWRGRPSPTGRRDARERLLAGVSPGIEDYRTAARLRTALLGFQRRSEEVCARNGLTVQRYLLLLLIRVGSDSTEPATVTRLCAPLQMTQSAVTQLVAGAERAGLIRRLADPTDGRSQRLRLTAKGASRLRRTIVDLGEERSRLSEAIAGLGRSNPSEG